MVAYTKPEQRKKAKGLEEMGIRSVYWVSDSILER